MLTAKKKQQKIAHRRTEATTERSVRASALKRLRRRLFAPLLAQLWWRKKRAKRLGGLRAEDRKAQLLRANRATTLSLAKPQIAPAVPEASTSTTQPQLTGQSLLRKVSAYAGVVERAVSSAMEEILTVRNPSPIQQTQVAPTTTHRAIPFPARPVQRRTLIQDFAPRRREPATPSAVHSITVRVLA